MSEALYTLTFTVDRTAATVTPNTPCPAGTRGDHRAARLIFAVEDTTASYYLEVTDGLGGHDVTAALTPESGQVAWDVPGTWTAPGTATVRLVETDGDRLIHYPPVRLLFSDRDEGAALAESAPRWQQLMVDAETAAKRAQSAANYADSMATDAQNAAEEAYNFVASTADYVVEQGAFTVSFWTFHYRKWNSGRMEAISTRSGTTVPHTTANGAVYSSSGGAPLYKLSLDKTHFTGIRGVQCTSHYPATFASAAVAESGSGWDISTYVYSLVSHTANIPVSFYLDGTWM